MTRPTLAAAFKGMAVGLALAAAVNLVLLAAAGDALHFPGEMSPVHVAGFTLAAIPFAAVGLWAVPRWFVPLAFAVAIGTVSFSYAEFGVPAAFWLGAMHVVAAAAASTVGRRLAGVRGGRRGEREPEPTASEHPVGHRP